MLIAFLVFFPVLMAFVSYVLGKKSEDRRDIFVIIVCFIELGAVLCLPRFLPVFDIDGILITGLHFMTDGFRCAYAIITAIMWAGTSLFSREYFKHEREGLNHYWFFVLVTLGATEGVMLSADLVTAFVCFEILSFTSFTWVIHEETPSAVRAGYTYLFIAVIGGLVLFMGLAMIYFTVGTLTFSELSAAVAASDRQGVILAGAICILVGFGCKAGMYPVHIWLPKAHPVAPSPASALLSGILTKVGVYGILMTSVTAMTGNMTFGLIVLILGLITMFLGAVLALFSVNLKRTLACSSMSQIGFILTGIGSYLLISGMGAYEAVHHEAHAGIALALSGTVLHMTNHSLIKLVLFMAAGVVIMNLHTLTLDDIRGWGRNKTALKIAFALGALGISGVPLFNGYISKTMLHEGIVHAYEIAEEMAKLCVGPAGMGDLAIFLKIAEWIFLVSGGCTFGYMLKLFICIFLEKNADPARQAAFDADSRCMNLASTIAICGSSVFMVVLGVPAVMKNLAFYMAGEDHILEFEAFIWVNLKGGLISLGIGAAIYLLIVRHVLYRNGSYVNLWPAWLDLEDLLYRPMITKWLPGLMGTVAAVFGENKVSGPAAAAFFKGWQSLAALFGEDKVLIPAAKGGFIAWSAVLRFFNNSLDYLIVFMRRTVIREVRPPRVRETAIKRMRAATGEVMRPIISNFSWALLMTCGGILIILCAILIALL